jgi:hypothetical protein
MTAQLIVNFTKRFENKKRNKKMATTTNISECKSFIRNSILNNNINGLVETIDELLSNNS